jgi:hypothetical protein
MVGFDPLAFPLIEFAMTYIALEGAWHFAVCRTNNADLALASLGRQECWSHDYRALLIM